MSLVYMGTSGTQGFHSLVLIRLSAIFGVEPPSSRLSISSAVNRYHHVIGLCTEGKIINFKYES